MLRAGLITLGFILCTLSSVSWADDETPSLWNVLRARLALQQYAYDDKVLAERKRLVNNRKYTRKLIDRSTLYLYYFMQEAYKRNLPGEFALIPFIESGFNPTAYSRSGASGFWQLMPMTAKRFGVETNQWFDGRRDLLSSTTAALDYLEYLADLFDNNWLLALAAYNAGEGTVRKAKQRAFNNGDDPNDFWGLALPKETQAYIPRLLAVSSLIMQAESFDMPLPELKMEAGFAVLTTKHLVDFSVLAKASGLSAKKLNHLNIGYRKKHTGPNGPHQLVLPANLIAKTQENLAAKTEWELGNWVEYTASSGDTYSSLAKQTNLSAKFLRGKNKAVKSLGEGVSIKIPSTELALLKQSKPVARVATLSMGEHVVQAGESLWAISRQYRLSVSTLLAINGLGPNEVLKPGQQLRLN